MTNQRYNPREIVFKTNVAPTRPETLEYLKGFRPPSTAYVLFEKQEIKVMGDGVRDFGTGLFTLNVEHRPEQLTKVNQYLGKGFKILHYDNFPGIHKLDSVAMRKARLYGGENQKNPWEELKASLDASIKNNPHWQADMVLKDEKLAAAEAKAAEMERRLADMERKLKGKDNKTEVKKGGAEVVEGKTEAQA